MTAVSLPPLTSSCPVQTLFYSTLIIMPWRSCLISLLYPNLSSFRSTGFSGLLTACQYRDRNSRQRSVTFDFQEDFKNANPNQKSYKESVCVYVCLFGSFFGFCFALSQVPFICALRFSSPFAYVKYLHLGFKMDELCYIKKDK